MKLKKLLIYISSWRHININEKINCIIITKPGNYDDCMDYFKGHLWIEPLHKNIFNFKLIFIGMKVFIKLLISKTFLMVKLWKFWPTIFFTCGLIKKNKIKNILSFTDYVSFPIYLKQLLGDQIKTVTMQNSSRAYPIKRIKYINKHDIYFSWSELNNKEKSTLNKKTKIHKFGSLRMHLVLNEKKNWNITNSFPGQNEKRQICLISNYATRHHKFFNKYFLNLNPDNFIKKLQDLEKEYLFNSKDSFGKIKKNINDYEQIIEFFYLVLFIKKFIEKNKFEISIIERHKPNHPGFKYEEDFYSNFFSRSNILRSQNHAKRIEYILNNKNLVFITNMSSLGREILGINQKVFTYSKWIYKFNESFFQKDSIFFCIDESYEIFENKLLENFNMGKENFENNKKSLKNTISAFKPNYNNLTLFLKETGLFLKN
ncbi:MAG: hypothetical protein CMG02_00235 [Candidatus Marinimicrobia bacterium]|nr:hypothetical protein [Candidatus Neomarinimicrobiota bacterium]|tara:strand:+ start:16855 stop:18144 length:1290 start_codon:yes stop_codon:yes gene_type:complete